MSLKKTILVNLQLGITQFTTAMSRVRGQMSGMTKAIGWASKAFVGLFAAAAVFRGMRRQIDTIQSYERAIQRVAAVTGEWGSTFKNMTEPMQRLSDNARQLGLTTRFTASEVAELSNELAKLGFSTDEIIKLSKATLNLASISNTALGRSAEIVGSTIRAFSMDASESTHVVNVLATALTSTALTAEKFNTAMGIVAPVATQAGLSIEQTTAMLGLLVNRGIDASRAGTGLRGILLDLSRHGITLQDAFDKIQNATDANKVAFELFGKRGATVATILSGVQDEVQGLTDKLIDSAGASDKMAAVIEDNLIGDTKRLKSAWEALVLEGGVLLPILRSIVQWLTRIIQKFNQLAAMRAAIAGMDKSEAEAEKAAAIKEKNRLVEERIALEDLKRSFEETEPGKMVGQQFAQYQKVKGEIDDINKAIEFQGQTYNAAIARLQEIAALERMILKSKKAQKDFGDVGGAEGDEESAEGAIKKSGFKFNMKQYFERSYEGIRPLTEILGKTKGQFDEIGQSISNAQTRTTEFANVINTFGQNFSAVWGTVIDWANLAENTFRSVIDSALTGFSNFGRIVRSILADLARQLLSLTMIKMAFAGGPLALPAMLGLIAGLGIVGGLAATAQDKVGISGRISGNDIYLANARTQQGFNTSGARVS